MIRIRVYAFHRDGGEYKEDKEFLINPKHIVLIETVPPGRFDDKEIMVIWFPRFTLFVKDPPSIDRILDLEGYNS